ncbi:MAG: hypothetical protein IJA02_05400 [Clostridia bacterium]|nr:hypothetical protein [Clostridia bacterium]
MLQNMQEFWYLYIILFVLIIITVFVWKKAATAATRHKKEVNEIMAKAKRNKEIRDAYKDLTAQIIENAPAGSLFEGVALNLEAACQKAENTENFYNSMTDGQKKIYAYYYLASEAKELKLSAFFKASSRPLTSDSVDAAELFVSKEIYAVIKEMFDCYDEENETASVIPQNIDRLNEEFEKLTKDIDLFIPAGEYIKNNPDVFLK